MKMSKSSTALVCIGLISIAAYAHSVYKSKGTQLQVRQPSFSVGECVQWKKGSKVNISKINSTAEISGIDYYLLDGFDNNNVSGQSQAKLDDEGVKVNCPATFK